MYRSLCTHVQKPPHVHTKRTVFYKRNPYNSVISKGTHIVPPTPPKNQKNKPKHPNKAKYTFFRVFYVILRFWCFVYMSFSLSHEVGFFIKGL